MKPTPAGRCRHCEAFQNFRGHAPGALCLDCNDRRLALKEQFNRFPIPADVVTSADALEAIRRDLVADAPRVSVPRPPAERLPYPDR